jgi:hypothetical protein
MDHAICRHFGPIMPYFAVIYRHHAVIVPDFPVLGTSPERIRTHVSTLGALDLKTRPTSWVSTVQSCRMRLGPVPSRNGLRKEKCCRSNAR